MIKKIERKNKIEGIYDTLIRSVIVKKFPKVISWTIDTTKRSISSGYFFSVYLYDAKDNPLEFREKLNIRKEMDSFFNLIGQSEYNSVDISFRTMDDVVSL